MSSQSRCDHTTSAAPTESAHSLDSSFDGGGGPCLRADLDVSVIICTYDRADSLRQTLATCSGLVIPNTLRWELIVVDNNSSDHTRSVCVEFAGRLPIRYLFEPRQGKSCALNNAIAHARGGLLLFTDDDVDVDPLWLANLHDTACRFPLAAFLGGRCMPRWEKPPPYWLEKHSRNLLLGVSVCLDKGDSTRLLGVAETPLLFGANLALRPHLMGGKFRFCEKIGPKANEGTRQEESLLQLELLAAGHQGVYVGSALVHHRNPVERMTEGYVRMWYKGAGIADVRMGQVDGSPHSLFGAPRYLWRVLLRQFSRYVVARLRCGSEVWLPAEIELARTWGWVSEFRRQHRQTNGPSRRRR